MHEVEVFRDNAAIDPTLHFWGWEIPLYLFLGGIAAGVMIISAWLRLRSDDEALSRAVRWVPLAAPIAISIGMLFLFLDLTHKMHVYRFYTTFEVTSPMSWGSWILVGIYPATILFGLGGMTREEIDKLVSWKPLRWLGGLIRWGHELATTHARRLAWSNIVLGVGLGAYTGLLIGTLAARPLWNSVMLAPLFLVSGLSTGAAMMMLLPVNDSEHHVLRRWDIIAIGAEMAFLALFFVGLLTGGGEPGRQAAALFFGGEYTAVFWSLVVVAGLAVPLALEVLESRRGLKATVLTPMLILIGGVSLRWIIVYAGQV